MRRPEMWHLDDVELPSGWGAKLVSLKTHPLTRLHFGFYWTYPDEETAFSFEEEDPAIPGYIFWPEMDDVYLVLEGSLRVTWENGVDSGELDMKRHDIAYLVPGYRYKTLCTSRDPALIFYCAAPPPEVPPDIGTIEAAKAVLNRTPQGKAHTDDN